MMKAHVTPRWIVASVAIAATLGLAQAARAQSPSVELHGFGGWAYANTDGNNLLIGTDEGSYDNVAMALNVTGKVSDRLTVVSQFEFQQRPGYEEMDQTLDFAFAEWKVNDSFKLRAGRVKHPFGIYGEIFNVGTLRPFYTLPLSIYGPQRYTARSVDGLGITGTKNWDGGWGLNYDVYAGRIAGELRIRGFGTPGEELHLGSQSLAFSFDEVLGGRLVVTTPVDGLSLGASAYHGKATVAVLSGIEAKETALDLQAEYQAEPVLLRAEYGTVFDDPTISYDTFYVEGAVKVYKGLQLAARFDRWQGDLQEAFIPPGYDSSSMKHRDIAFGLNYWLSPSFVMKASYHIVQGNLFALPDDPTALLAHDTNMFVVGTQFSF
jgi:hypothetical protein